MKTILDYFSKIKPKVGSSPASIGHRSLDKVLSILLPKFENFSGQAEDGFRFIIELKIDFVKMKEPKCMAIFTAL